LIFVDLIGLAVMQIGRGLMVAVPGIPIEREFKIKIIENLNKTKFGRVNESVARSIQTRQSHFACVKHL
jgi:hypothetical protein